MPQKKVKAIHFDRNQFQIECTKGEVFSGRFVLLATGSHPSGFAIARSFGHRIVEPVPSLFTFNISDPRLENLAGISFEKVSLRLGSGKRSVEQPGGLLITHWGLSGPAVLRSSAWAARELHENNYEGRLAINFAPDETEEQIREVLYRLLSDNPGKELSALPTPWFPKRYWKQLVTGMFNAGMRCAEVSKKGLNRLVDEIRRAEFRFTGKSTNKDEFVTAGGVALREIDFRCMESKLQPGLFFAGEILDVDGITGGFNFQNAWTTAFLSVREINLRSVS